MTDIEPQEMKYLSDQELHRATEKLVKQERKISLIIVHHLKEIDRRRLWAKMAYSSLFEYCTKALGYSESQAYRRISALKLIREIPEVEEKIVSGGLNLTTISQVQTFFRQESKIQNRKLSPEEKHFVLEMISGKTQKETAIELAKLDPDIPKPDREKAVADSLTQIQFIADQELMAKFKRLRDLLSHQISPVGNYSDLLHKISDIALEKLEPKATKTRHTASAKRLSVVAKTIDSKSRYIPVETERSVWRRDQGQCCYRDPFTNRRCACRSGLEIDHILPFAKGGDSSLDNLRLLCRSHNQLAAIQEFGAAKMRNYIAGI